MMNAQRPLPYLIAAGLALLVLGAHWLVDAAMAFAQHLGISERSLYRKLKALGLGQGQGDGNSAT